MISNLVVFDDEKDYVRLIGCIKTISCRVLSGNKELKLLVSVLYNSLLYCTGILKGRDFLTWDLYPHKTEIEIKNILKIEKNRYSRKSKSDEFFDFWENKILAEGEIFFPIIFIDDVSHNVQSR